MQPFPVTQAGLNCMTECVAEIENGAQAAFAFVGSDYISLHLARALHRMRERSRIAIVQSRDVRLDPLEEFAVGNGARLDHFGDTRGEFTRRQRLERSYVSDDRLRLIKRADHVLAERMIDAGLPTYRRIDLREQRGRHLDKGHAAPVT